MAGRRPLETGPLVFDCSSGRPVPEAVVAPPDRKSEARAGHDGPSRRAPKLARTG
jgi:hypothetical protein